MCQSIVSDLPGSQLKDMNLLTCFSWRTNPYKMLDPFNYNRSVRTPTTTKILVCESRLKISGV
jgi:hypothetical protein